MAIFYFTVRENSLHFYDLICTRAIEHIDYHLAFDIGGETNPSVITKTNWGAFAEQCDVRPRIVRKYVMEMAALLLQKIIAEKNKFEQQFGPYPALQRIEYIVTKQCQSLTKAL